MSENRRLSQRKDQCRIGTLRPEGAASAIACLVWDVSPGGAWVEVAHPEPSERFLLSTGDGEAPRACTVVRREGRGFGVRFD